MADKIALQAASEGLPIVPVYPGVIYGPGKLTTGNLVAKLVRLLFSQHFFFSFLSLSNYLSCNLGWNEPWNMCFKLSLVVEALVVGQWCPIGE